jgi:prevent-host-death family protein
MARKALRTTTLTSREFNQDTAGAKKAAAHGPVIITVRGQPAHVLLTYERFQELTGRSPDIVTLLGMAEGSEIDFEPPKVRTLSKPVTLD